MTRKKQRVQALISFSIVIVFTIACGSSTKNQRIFDQYDEEWLASKSLFYNNCSQCHTPRNKDVIFYNYIEISRKLEYEKKIEKLRTVLNDTNHISKNINTELLKDAELKQLVLYIETPQRKGTVN